MVGVKNNRRTKYTVELIKKSFLDLLETRTLPQITVTEICKRADINRGTFYIHFKDQYQLFDVLQKELNQQILDLFRKDQVPCSADGSLIKLLNIIQEKRMIYRMMTSESRERSFFSEAIMEAQRDYLERLGHEQNNDPTEIDYSFTYMVQGSVGIINQWLESNRGESPAVIAQIIASLTRYNIIFRKE